MPWHVVEDHADCPVSRPFGVVKDDDGSLEGCHESMAAAHDQMAALYASEGATMSNSFYPGLTTRSFPFEAAGDGLTLEGYAAVYNSPTVIDSWHGPFEEVIAPGAFAKTARKNPPPLLQFDHGTHPLLGEIPIGVITSMRDDKKGLFVRARLSDNWLIQPIRDAIRDGAIQGMSFRFVIPDGGVTVDESGAMPRHTISNVDVHELGPVVWPAYRETEVSIRSNLVQALDDPKVRSELANVLVLSHVHSETEGPSPSGDRPDGEESTGATDEVADRPDGPSAGTINQRALRERMKNKLVLFDIDLSGAINRGGYGRQ